MPATIVVGLQWGDEGKGKTTDLLCGSVSHVVRYQGGDNAGHTVVIGDEVFKLHLVPSGVLHPHITPVIGPGVVVNPRTLLDEMAMLTERGISTAALRVSEAAHVIMPYHVALDGAREVAAEHEAIGTTRRGIGPAYGDRALRTGIRMGDLLEPDWLRLRLAAVLPEKNALLERAYGRDSFDFDVLYQQALEWGEQLREHITDTTALLQQALRDDRVVLLEGAQGTLLDLDHGTYPYVTSSHPVAGGACAGAGLGPLQVDQVIGVLKAYSTRVGAGPFPTELHDEVGEGLRQRGREFGTTTGRPRRCGWLDLVPLRRAVAINSVSAMMLNKIDILSGLGEIRVCVAYRIDGQLVEEWPQSLARLERAEPVYESFPGWQADIGGARHIDDLPPEARRFVAAIEERAGAPIALVSVGPERRQTLVNAASERQPLAGVAQLMQSAPAAGR
ncbi:MAG TPA: adenylosuccinate synthase [Candidatus Limnocylindrales bacterium]|jgi:adenylosuccinate synthase|nr:adenylosuccinate synthase [Candidatus Limnocylindrales bacterium]